MLNVAWGRLEGHVIGNLLTLMNASGDIEPLPLAWEKRLDLWKRAFGKVPSLRVHKERAVAFLQEIIAAAEDRNLVAHAIWGEFVADAAEPTIKARRVRPRRGKENVKIVDVSDYHISLTLLRLGITEANRLNYKMTEFTNLLNSVRPPPADARKF